MDETLREAILDALHRHGRAATYGAVAGLVAATARNVMKTARQSDQCSWVVSAGTKRPTGYPPHRIDPRLPESVERHGVLRNPEELQDWLASVGAEL
ncbi:MAG: hypothetical protein AAF805_08200 [Planctomycetota bacterium]